MVRRRRRRVHLEPHQRVPAAVDGTHRGQLAAASQLHSWALGLRGGGRQRKGREKRHEVNEGQRQNAAIERVPQVFLPTVYP